MITGYFLHVHIGMLHGVLLTGRNTVFYELPSFIDFQPVVGIESFEGSNEGFLICIYSYRFKYGGNLAFLSAYETAHCEYPSHALPMYIWLTHSYAVDALFSI